MLFKKASIFIFCILCSYNALCESFNVRADFSKKENIVVVTTDQKTNSHNFFEYYIEYLFNRVPYLKIQNLNELPVAGMNIENYHPDFAKMEASNHSYLLYYTLEEVSGNKIILSYILFDGLYQNNILSHSYTFNANQLKKYTQYIATDIFFQITNEFPFFLGKIFYTKRSNATGYQVLYSQDFEKNIIQYTEGRSMLTSPAYCSNGKKIIFAQQERYISKIREVNTTTLNQKYLNIPTFENLNILSPSFSGDCSEIAFGSSNGYKSGIYLHNFSTKKTTELVKDTLINTKPIFGQNNLIYYISNKHRAPKIFAINRENRSSQVVSRGLGHYISFDISPDGDKIAFIKILNGHFYIGVMNYDGSDEILLHKAYIIESPSWAPIGTNFIASVQATKNSFHRTIYSFSSVTGFKYPLPVAHENIVEARWVLEENTQGMNQNN